MVTRLRASGVGIAQIARGFNVHRRTVWHWFKKAAELPESAQKPRTRFRKVSEEGRAWLATTAKARVVVTQMELAKLYHQQFGISISQQHVSRILREQGVSRKIVAVMSSEAQEQPERHLDFHAKISSVDQEHLAALDESTFHINEGARYGYSERGQRAVVYRPSARGTKINLCLCVSRTQKDGNWKGSVVAFRLYEGNMTTDRFTSFLGDLTPGLSVITDNAGFHGAPWQRRKDKKGVGYYQDMRHGKAAKAVQKAAADAGVELVYLRPRSPQFNPCEHVFSVVKSRVRRDCPGTVDDLIASIRRALEYIGEMDLGPTFDHCVRASQGESDRLQLLLPSTTWTRPQYPALPGSNTAPRLAEEVEMSSGSAAGAPAGPGGQGGSLQPGTVAEASGSHEANEGSAGPPDPLKTTFVSYVFESKVSGAESRLNGTDLTHPPSWLLLSLDSSPSSRTFRRI